MCTAGAYQKHTYLIKLVTVLRHCV